MNPVQSSYVENSISNLDKAIIRLATMRDLIRQYAAEASSAGISHENRVEAELTLRGILLLYETVARPLSAYISSLEKIPESGPFDHKLPKLALALEGDWISHELSRFLGSLSYLYNVIAVSHKIRSEEGGYRLHIPETRSHIYRNAQLYYYLDRNEELRIHQIHMSSPGIVEFIMSHYEHGALLVGLLIVISKSPKVIDSLITVWNRLRDSLRDQRRKDRNEEIEKKIHDYFVDVVIPRFGESDQSLDTSALMTMNKSITDLSKMKLADPVSATDNILRALAVLTHLHNSGKFQLIDTKKEDE